MLESALKYCKEKAIDLLAGFGAKNLFYGTGVQYFRLV